MTKYVLPYGTSSLSIRIPGAFEVHELRPKPTKPIPQTKDFITQAISMPAGNQKLEYFINAQDIGIVINDKTRPRPNTDVLKPLLKYMDQVGFVKKFIKIFIGSGTHKPMPENEWPTILDQEIIDQYPIIVHDCDHSPMMDLGTSSYQTPVFINEAFAKCDLKITLGNIEPHHFMGFSGGVKTAAIGLASRKTITTNHAMLTREQVKSGIFHSNPMRQDIEEIGQKLDVQFTLGTILDENKNILRVVFGNPATVMKTAVPIVNNIFGVKVTAPYDLVIASPGGYPKDINLYQSQKALTHAARITKDGGWVLLLAECSEGSGSDSYEKFITQLANHREVINKFERGFFEIGPHKAFQIARDAVRVNIVLVSSIPPIRVKKWKLTPSKPELLDQLINWFIARLPSEARIALLPDGTRTMTEVKG
jgi:nickel-dependent lactate racemase